jgi:hypothetical protein
MSVNAATVRRRPSRRALRALVVSEGKAWREPASWITTTPGQGTGSGRRGQVSRHLATRHGDSDLSQRPPHESKM